VSRQRFQAAFARNDIHYDQLTGLDFTARRGERSVVAAGNDASGQLGYTETLALASFLMFAFKNTQVTPIPQDRQASSALPIRHAALAA